jgi:transcriptional regulator with XRE-family HTH domain
VTGGTFGEYDAGILGAPFGVLLVESVRIDGDDVTFPDAADLVAAASMARLRRDERLTGAELRYLRRSAGLPREDLGRAFGGSESDVEAYERGPRAMTLGLEKYVRLHIHHALSRMEGVSPARRDMSAYMDWVFEEWRPTFATAGNAITIRLRHDADGWRETEIRRE